MERSYSLLAGKEGHISNNKELPEVEIAAQFHFRPATKRKNPPGITERVFSASVAERPLLISNLLPLNSLEISRLKKAVSPHKILTDVKGSHTDILSRDLVTINEFLHFVEAEPYLAPEKTESHKRIAFKKDSAI